jgi:phage-related protein
VAQRGFEFISTAAKRDFRKLPVDVQRAFLTDILALRDGKAPFSAMIYLVESVGKGAFELKRNGSPAHRVVCCLKYLDTVFLLHAFAKSTNGVDHKNMATARVRYSELTARIREAR